MNATTTEIADGIYRIATLVPGVLGRGLTYNQFLVVADEPLLFHCGMRTIFPGVAEAVRRVLPLERLRWVSFSHLEADECGALDLWLAACPHLRAAHGRVGCQTWLNDACGPRAPRALADGEVLDLGGRRVRRLDTPHVPHGWDAGLLFEEATATLFSSDLLASVGDGPALVGRDVVRAAIEAEELFERGGGPGPTNLGVRTEPTLARLAALAPKTIAVMHGPSTNQGAPETLAELGGYFGQKVRALVGAAG